LVFRGPDVLRINHPFTIRSLEAAEGTSKAGQEEGAVSDEHGAERPVKKQVEKRKESHETR